MSKYRVLAAVLAVAMMGCTEGESGRTATLEVELEGLPELGMGYVYEGWLVTSRGHYSMGRFTDPTGHTVKVGRNLLELATAYLLTIEPVDGDDPYPSSTHLLSGALQADGAALTMHRADAMGADLEGASGGFILETQTSDATGNYQQGIWYLQRDEVGSLASLQMPPLPAGWVYEGWVVVGGIPQSTGRFSSTSCADGDGAGPTAGPGRAPSFPGQDFIDPQLSLVGATAVISVEPEPDDSPTPFTLEVLTRRITDDGEAVLQSLHNRAAETAISGRLTIIGAD